MRERERQGRPRTHLGTHAAEERLWRHRRRAAELLYQPHAQILPLAVPPEDVPRNGPLLHRQHVHRERTARGHGKESEHWCGWCGKDGPRLAHLLSGLAVWKALMVAPTAAPGMLVQACLLDAGG